MTAITTTQIIDAIVDEVTQRAGDVTATAAFGNSFEGWLKFELARGLCRRFQLDPWDHWTEKGGVGVEYRYKALPRDDESARKKLIDLWVGHNPTVYVELKVVFCKTNEGKQLRSWESDFAALESVLDGEPDVAGFASILLGVGFDDDRWRSALARASRRSEVFRNHAVVVPGPAPLRMASLRQG